MTDVFVEGEKWALKMPISDLIVRHQIKAKFIFVGVWNTIFGYCIFCLLETIFSHIFVTRYIGYMSAMILGQIIAVINAYVFHKYITFRSETKGKGAITEFIRFCTTYIVTFCLSLILLPFFVEIFLITPKIAGAIVILVCTVVSYFGHSRFSFRMK